MSETAPTFEHAAPGFEAYLQMVKPYIDENVFHPLVVDSEEDYQSLVNRHSTIMLGPVPEILRASEAPETVDSKRSLDIAQSLARVKPEDVYVSIVPSERLVKDMPALIDLLPEKQKTKVIFSELEIVNEDTQQQYQALLNPMGIKVHALEHPRLKSEASLNLFELNLTLKSRPDSTLSTSQVIAKGLVKGVISQENGKIISKSGDKLTEDEFSRLWQLFSTRFKDISDNMPASLEESEESTRRLMFDSNYSFIYKKNNLGEVVACLFFSDNPDAYPWINPAFLQKREQVLREKGKPSTYSIFIPGIAAEQNGNGVKAASEILMQLTEILAQTNQPVISVRFECTDVSSRYVPFISMRAARQQSQFRTSEIEQVGLKKYIALEIPPQSN